MMSFKKILWPTDFSPLARRALPIVNEMARRFAASVTVVHAIQLPPPAAAIGAPDVAPMSLAVHRSEARAKAEKALAELTKSTVDEALERSWELIQGTPALAVADYARDHGIDLIVLCTHGESGLVRLVFGSFTEKLVRTASCPVLVVPARDHVND